MKEGLRIIVRKLETKAKNGLIINVLLKISGLPIKLLNGPKARS